MSALRPAPPASRRLPLGVGLDALEPFRSPEDALEGLTALESAFREVGDRRGVFALASRRFTEAIRDWLAHGRFEEPEAIRRFVVVFADAYRRALVDDAGERADRVPAAWRLGFDAARSRRTSVVQDLLLGINAHVNHDMPFAILDAGIDAACERCHRDHVVVNDALRQMTPIVRLEVVRRYAPALGLPARLAGRSLDRALLAAYHLVRQRAWQGALALQRAHTAAERRRLGRAIEERAACVGAGILAGRGGTRRRFAMLCLGGGLPDPAAPAA